MRGLAITLSLLSAVALAFGAQFQNQAVTKNQNADRKRLGLKAVLDLLKRPRWLTGMSLLVGGALLQITALTLAPLIVVQPIGAVALAITALLNARSTKTSINKSTWLAITLCTFGIATFVAFASNVAKESHLDDGNLAQILGVLVVIVTAFLVAFFTFAKRAKAITYILGAGILYGFVASLIKAVVQRVAQGDISLLTIVCALTTGIAVLLGGWFVQNAYASGPPDLVIAGLTVVDPMVAVLVGIIVLGEAKSADPLVLSAFAVSGLIAITGVWLLSRVHPELANGGKDDVV
jgi:drug/metabolite transporter (DMT)-like permease